MMLLYCSSSGQPRRVYSHDKSASLVTLMMDEEDDRGDTKQVQASTVSTYNDYLRYLTFTRIRGQPPRTKLTLRDMRGTGRAKSGDTSQGPGGQFASWRNPRRGTSVPSYYQLTTLDSD